MERKLFNFLQNQKQEAQSYNFLNCDKVYLKKPQSQPNIEKDNSFVDDIRSMAENLSIKSDEKKANINDQQLLQIQKKAIKHSLANILNQNTSEKFEKKSKESQCECGCNREAGQQLPLLTTSIQNLTFLGSSLILFFMFVKRLAYLLILIIVVYNIFALFTNIFGEIQPIKCADNALKFWCIIKMYTSIDMKDPNGYKMAIQLWLGLLLCFFWIIGIRLIRKLSRQKNTQIDVCLDSSSDYSILIDQLPYGDIKQKQIIGYLQNLWQHCEAKQILKEKISIKSVQIIYRTKEIRDIIQSLKSNIIEINSLLEDNQYRIKIGKEQQYYNLKQIIYEQSQNLKMIKGQFLLNEDYRKKMATTMCLVEFGNSAQQTYFLQQFGYIKKTILSNLKAKVRSWVIQSYQLPKIKGQSVRITRSPQPSDLNWQACQVQESYFRIFIVWIILLIIILVSFGCLLIIRQLRRIFPVLKTFSLLISVSLQLFNRIIWNTLLKVIKIEENNTKTDQIISVMNKSLVSQACNTILLPIILNIILDDNTFGPAGLASQAFDFQIVLIIMMINFNLINVPYQIQRLLLCISPIKRYIIKSKCKIFQDMNNPDNYRQVLKYYQGPDFPIAAAYVYMNTFIFHGIFYIHLQPCLFIIMILNIAIFYVIKKYLLLRRCKIPDMIDMIVLENCLNSLMYAPLIYGAGSCLFTCLKLENINNLWFLIPSLLCILLGIMNMIDPYNIFDKFVSFLLKIRPKIIPIEASLDNPSEIENSPENLIDQQINKIDTTVPKKTLVFFLNNYENFSSRIQSYYKGCNLSKLLSYQLQFSQPSTFIRTKINSEVKRFCQGFQKNYPPQKLPSNESEESHHSLIIMNKKLSSLNHKDITKKSDC